MIAFGLVVSLVRYLGPIRNRKMKKKQMKNEKKIFLYLLKVFKLSGSRGLKQILKSSLELLHLILIKKKNFKFVS
jgi:hypothetical protein